MTNNQKWIKIHHNLLESSIMYNKDLLQLWMFLLLTTNQEGECDLSQRKYSKEFKVDLSKVNRMLKLLKSESYIVTSPNSKFTKIQIKNYPSFQINDAPQNSQIPIIQLKNHTSSQTNETQNNTLFEQKTPSISSLQQFKDISLKLLKRELKLDKTKKSIIRRSNYDIQYELLYMVYPKALDIKNGKVEYRASGKTKKDGYKEYKKLSNEEKDQVVKLAFRLNVEMFPKIKAELSDPEGEKGNNWEVYRLYNLNNWIRENKWLEYKKNITIQKSIKQNSETKVLP